MGGVAQAQIQLTCTGDPPQCPEPDPFCITIEPTCQDVCPIWPEQSCPGVYACSVRKTLVVDSTSEVTGCIDGRRVTYTCANYRCVTSKPECVQCLAEPTSEPTPNPTLSVTLSAATNGSTFSSTGLTSATAPLNGVDLRATVSGTATGTITYRYDCTNNGSYERTANSSTSPNTQNDVCSYSSLGNYVARIRVSRGGEIAEDTIPITIGTPTPSPSPSPTVTTTPTPNSTPSVTSVNVTQPNYCASGLAATVQWTYSDPNGDPQNAYQVQIDNDSAFGSPEVDSCLGSSPTCVSGNTSTSYFTSSSNLLYDTNYNVRVRVWDSGGGVSAWY